MKDISTTSVSYEDLKKNDEPTQNDVPQPSGGMLWGVWNTTKGAVGASVGYGVAGVKLVANTSYVVVAKTAEVGVGATKAVASTGYNAVSGSVSAVSGGVSAVTSKLPLPSLSRGKDKTE